MKILIRNPDRKPKRILLPTGLIFSAFTATVASGLIRRTAQKHGTAREDLQPISGKNLRRLFRELRRSKKRLKTLGLPLVEVTQKNDESVTVTL